MTFFETTITYWDEDPNVWSTRLTKFTHTLGYYAESYTDAEVIGYKWAQDNINVDYVLSPIKEMNISGIYPTKEGGLWFLCKCVYLTENMNGKIKEKTLLYLVQAEDCLKANKKILEVLKEEVIGASRVVQITESKIKTVLTVD